MDQHQPASKTTLIPINVRVLIGIVASPTLMVIWFVVNAMLQGQWKQLSVGGIIFTLLGVFAYYLVLVGKLPKWMHYSKKRKTDDK